MGGGSWSRVEACQVAAADDTTFAGVATLVSINLAESYGGARPLESLWVELMGCLPAGCIHSSGCIIFISGCIIFIFLFSAA